MKTAGSILSTLFDNQFVQKAHGYSKFFNSWSDITAKNGMPYAADHSRIKDLDKGIVVIELDHPGWKQILQSKQSKLLSDFRIRFPELDISGISLMLGYTEPQSEKSGLPQPEAKADEEPVETEPPAAAKELPAKRYDDIKDEDFKAALKKLGKTVADREKASHRGK